MITWHFLDIHRQVRRVTESALPIHYSLLKSFSSTVIVHSASNFFLFEVFVKFLCVRVTVPPHVLATKNYASEKRSFKGIGYSQQHVFAEKQSIFPWIASLSSGFAPDHS